MCVIVLAIVLLSCMLVREYRIQKACEQYNSMIQEE